MEKYKEQIEKEANEYAKTFYPNEEYNNFMGCLQTGFISGVNSKIAERIKYEFAIEVLEEVKNTIDIYTKSYNNIDSKITELKNKIQ